MFPRDPMEGDNYDDPPRDEDRDYIDRHEDEEDDFWNRSAPAQWENYDANHSDKGE